MITRAIVIILAFTVVLSIPYVVRPAKEVPPEDALQLVMISPHIEAIQYEFGRAFRDWHEAKYGRPVVIDWRNIGGTSELARYIESEFAAGFKLHWTRTLGNTWDAKAAAGFNDYRIDAALASQPANTDAALEARRAFLASNVGVGLDIFFGGGSFDHDRAARKGYLVDSGLAKDHPEWLRPEIIPQAVGGEIYYDKQGRWYGACLTTFGICYNRDSLQRLGIEKPPTEWADLADPRYFLQIGLADPTKSGSIAKSFEMIIQQQMHQEVDARKAAAGPAWNKQMEQEAVAAGWDRAMRLIQRIAANGRYFTEGASSVVTDVADGNAAAGMSIDYYTRFSAESVAMADGESRLQYVTPVGGTSVSADPVAMFRGAPNPEVARHFIEFVMSEDGQRLWNYKVAAPGGPVKYALRRLPIRKDMYTPEHRRYMSDPKEEPYAIAAQMAYRPDWTAALFNFLRPYIQSMAIQPHAELRAAWRAILDRGGPEANPEAMRVLGEMPLTYEQAGKQDVANPFSRMALTRGWAGFFKANYEVAAERAATATADKVTR
jgi:ABC-type Fe3+ transport system substrate-binding protein